MTTHVLTWGRNLMADLKDGLQDSRMVDAQKLWLPVGKVIAIAVGFVALIFGLGMWTQRTNDRTESAAGLEVQLQSINNQIATMQGSINVLAEMNKVLAETRADVGALDSRVQALDRNTSERLNMMDAWIQTTRDRLRDQGFRDVPDYRPQGHGGGE